MDTPREGPPREGPPETRAGPGERAGAERATAPPRPPPPPPPRPPRWAKTSTGRRATATARPAVSATNRIGERTQLPSTELAGWTLCNQGTTEPAANRTTKRGKTTPAASSRPSSRGGGDVANWGRFRTNVKKSYDATWEADGAGVVVERVLQLRRLDRLATGSRPCRPARTTPGRLSSRWRSWRLIWTIISPGGADVTGPDGSGRASEAVHLGHLHIHGGSV